MEFLPLKYFNQVECGILPLPPLRRSVVRSRSGGRCWPVNGPAITERDPGGDIRLRAGPLSRPSSDNDTHHTTSPCWFQSQLSISITLMSTSRWGCEEVPGPWKSLLHPLHNTTSQHFSSVSPGHDGGRWTRWSNCNYLTIDCCLTWGIIHHPISPIDFLITYHQSQTRMRRWQRPALSPISSDHCPLFLSRCQRPEDVVVRLASSQPQESLTWKTFAGHEAFLVAPRRQTSGVPPRRRSLMLTTSVGNYIACWQNAETEHGATPHDAINIRNNINES